MPELSAALATAPALVDPIVGTDTLAVVRGSPPSLYTVSQQRLLAGLATTTALNSAVAGVTPTSAQVTAALGFTPYDAANPSGYQTASQVSAVLPVASTVLPTVNGAAAIGTSAAYARANHVHATDATRAPLASPVFTGSPAAPTAAAGTNSTVLATTAFVSAAVSAVSGSATLTKAGICTALGISVADFDAMFPNATAGT